MSPVRIPLFKVIEAIKVAAARQRTKRATQAALDMVPMGNVKLRDAIREVACAADWQGCSRSIFVSKAIGGAA